MPDAYLTGLAGGLLIGLAAVLLMMALGRIAGISGIVFNGFRNPILNAWALLFLVGLIAGAWSMHLISGIPVPAFDVPLPLLLAGGFIVGVGTKLGSGCTSGHGICGIGRLSVRSIIATVTFMSFGIGTVYLRLHGGVL